VTIEVQIYCHFKIDSWDLYKPLIKFVRHNDNYKQLNDLTHLWIWPECTVLCIIYDFYWNKNYNLYWSILIKFVTVDRMTPSTTGGIMDNTWLLYLRATPVSALIWLKFLAGLILAGLIYWRVSIILEQLFSVILSLVINDMCKWSRNLNF
jgi:hypothetical protein